MPRKLVLGVGLAALVGGSAAGQFAGDRVPPVGAPNAAPALPGGLEPAGAPAPPAPVLGGFSPGAPSVPAPVAPVAPAAPAAYVPPVDGLRAPTYGSATPAAPAASYVPVPVNVEIPTVLGKDHPWLIKPEHGPYFIIVKSYVRPAANSDAAKEELERKEKGLSARELAEGLASEIRDTYRVQAFLFEYISEERKAEERARIAARQKAQAYVAQLGAMKQKAQLQGMEFMTPDNRLHIMSHRHNDQIGVLVGGFQTEADAIKALAILKKWPMPKNEVLCDKGAISQPGAGGKFEVVTAAINPYATAFVVPNPSTAKTTQPSAPPKTNSDPFLVKLNEDNPYSLLKATRGWTLAVKSFTSPVQVVGAKEGDGGLMRKLGFSKGADVLAAGAEQAESMAKALRAMKGRGGESMNLEAFVLHTRTASIVTVGQFDGPDDPALLATKRMLAGMTAKVTEDQGGTRAVMNAPSLFEQLIPMPVPKQ